MLLTQLYIIYQLPKLPKRVAEDVLKRVASVDVSDRKNWQRRNHSVFVC